MAETHDRDRQQGGTDIQEQGREGRSVMESLPIDALLLLAEVNELPPSMRRLIKTLINE